MKYVLIAIAALALAAPATASAPSRDPRVPGLMKQVASLKTQVKTLREEGARRDVKIATANDRAECYFALNSANEDAFYRALSVIGQRTGLPALPPGPGKYDDHGACARIGVSG